MKICDHCGTQNEDSTKYCTNCGARFPEPQSEPEQDPVYSSYDNQYQSEYQPTYQPTYQTGENGYDQSVYRPVMNDAAQKGISALAMTGFIISLISIFCCGFTAPLGLIFSVIGLIVTINKSKRGIGFAIAGLVINGLLTLFILMIVAASWSAINEAMNDPDVQNIDEFFEVLEEELDEESGSSGRSSRTSRTSRRSGDEDDADVDDVIDEVEPEDLSYSGEWTDYELADDYSQITVTYTDGIPDDYGFYGADFDEICIQLEDNLVSTDNFGTQFRFDREVYDRLVSMVLISPEEYDNMDLSREQTLYMLSYLAALSYEMDHDGFMPERAVYTEATNTYDFYGVLEENNIGHAVIVFTDGTNDVYFEDAMCGDEICWSTNFSTDVYRLGMSADTLNDYPANGFAELTSYIGTLLDPLL